MAFGDVEVGTTSTQTLSFSNSGSTSLTVSQTGVSGSGFTVSGVTSPLTLPAGQSGSLSVQFAPTVTGSVSGSVSVVSNASNSPTTITLSGNGVRHQLSLTPTSISFGNVAVGTANTQTITLTNSGTANLNISQGSVTGAGFSMSGLNFPVALAPGQSGTLNVQFAPTAIGSASGSVTLVSNTRNSPDIVSLAGNGIQPASGQLIPNPSNIIFGNVTVGSTSAQTVALANTGSAAVTVSQATVSGTGFSITGPTLPLTIAAGQSNTLSLQFAPTAIGSVPGSVSLVSNAPNSPTSIPLSGTGVAAILQLAASPTSQSFGNVLVGSSSSSQMVVLTNTGNSSVSISQINVSGAGFSASGLSVPLNVAAGQSVSLSVVFAPTATGSATGSVSVVSNATNSPTTISLSGAGVQPQISVVPASVSFGNVTVGLTNTQTMTLSNPGSANLSVSQATLTGASFALSGLTLPLTVAPGQSTTFTVSFTPTVASSATGSLSLVSNAPGSPLTVALSGTGVAPILQLSASPASLSFGNVTLGSSSTQTVALTNMGNSSVSISQISVSGAGFTTSGLTPPLTLTAGQTATLNVVFTPTTAGGVSGSVTVTSNATNSPAAITLSGSAHSVTLTWNPSTSVVAGYYIYRGTLSGGPYTKLNPTPVSLATYIDTAVQSGLTYFYVATAVDSSNVESVLSNEISATIP